MDGSIKEIRIEIENLHLNNQYQLVAKNICNIAYAVSGL